MLKNRAANKNADTSGHRNSFFQAQIALFSTEIEKNLWESWRKKVAIMRHRHRFMPVDTSFPPPSRNAYRESAVGNATD